MKFFLFSSILPNFSPRLFSSWFLLLFIFLHVAQRVQSLAIKQQPELFEKQKLQPELKNCNFDVDSKDRSVSDLLRCTDHLAANSLPPTNQEFSKELDKVFENFQKSFSRSRGRQGPGLGGFPYDEGSAGSFYRPGRPISDPPGGGFYGNNGFPGYPGPYDPSGTFSSGLVEALTSISQYDDLKCVPRLLCEIATGSNPGNGEYKASSFDGFGKNTLIGLLTAYNFEEASPVLAFGKAALLGYTSRGDPSICYQEYVRCPNDPRDLVHYLNNHNGGFFRFFKNARRRPAVQGSNRVGFALNEPAPPPGLSGPESYRTGTGELKFDTPEPSPRQDAEKSELRLTSDVFSRVVFPGDEKTGDHRGDASANRVSKSLESSSSSGFFPEFSNRDFERNETPVRFFPSDYEELEKTNVVFENEEDSREKNYYSDFENGRLLVPDYENDEKSVFTFPDREENASSDSDVSKLFPSN